MQQYQDFLNQTAPHQTYSIESYELNGIKVWLKKSVKRHSKWLYMPVNWLAKIFRFELLIPVPNYGGALAIECEAKRLTDLAHHGITVPKVLAISKAGLLIQDMASHDKELMQLDHALGCETNFEKRKALFLKACEEIKKVHQKNQYLSEAFARNILIDSNQNISFIDFETDPATVFDLKTSQTRDWLCFLFSTAFRFENHERIEIEEIVKDYLDDYAILQLSTLGKRFSWLNKVGVEKTGNDGKRLKIFIIFLKSLGKR